MRVKNLPHKTCDALKADNIGVYGLVAMKMCIAEKIGKLRKSQLKSPPKVFPVHALFTVVKRVWTNGAVHYLSDVRFRTSNYIIRSAP